MTNRRSTIATFCSSVVAIACGLASGMDKNGLAPNVISLPKGPGSLTGFGGEYSWMTDTSKGVAGYSIALKVPPGPASSQPAISLSYSSANGNGLAGFGWQLSFPRIYRRWDKGMPGYHDTMNPIRNSDLVSTCDQFMTHFGEVLVETKGGSWFCESEEHFLRYHKLKDGWMATAPDGGRIEFGTDEQSRIVETGTERIFQWNIRSARDRHGNEIIYEYERQDGEYNTNQVYLRSISYGAGSREMWAQNHHFVYFEYEERDDWTESAQSGFIVRAGLRLKSAIVATRCERKIEGHARGDFNQDGDTNDYLVRKYEFRYEADCVPSLLASVIETGSDNQTQLPPHSFRYTELTHQKQIAADKYIIRTQGLPRFDFKPGLDEIVDLNGDGLGDILRTNGPRHSALLNLGQAERDAPIVFTQPQKLDDPDLAADRIQLNKDSAYLSDVDGDGLSDLTYMGVIGDTFYFPNTGRVGWGKLRKLTLNQNSRPAAPFTQLKPEVRVVDLNLDKRPDILSTLDRNTFYTWYCIAKSSFSDLALSKPTEGIVSSKNVQLADMNGDSLLDMVFLEKDRAFVSTSLGFGRFSKQRQIRPTQMNGVIGHRKLVDVTGDGLADLVSGPNGKRLVVWQNLGNYSFSQPIEISNIPRMATSRWVDLNGNGSTDLFFADRERNIQPFILDIGMALGAVPKPSLLVSISNGIGETIDIKYGNSTEFMIADRVSAKSWTSFLPFPVTVVKEERVSNSLGVTTTTRYRYHNGFYDGIDKEFRGFIQVDTTKLGDESAPTLVTRSTFDTGQSHRALRGKLLSSVVEDEKGRIFSETKTTWTQQPRELYRSLDNQMSIVFTYPEKHTMDIRERGVGRPQVIEKEFEYDNFGNIVRQVEHGVKKANGDERVFVTEFAIDTDRWMLRFPKESRVETVNGEVFAKTRYYYDDEQFTGRNFGQLTKGNLTLERKWFDIAANEYVNNGRARYDSYGNAIELHDPLSSGRADLGCDHFRKIDFDPLFHTQAIRESVALGGGKLLKTSADYDWCYGKPTKFTAFNGAKTVFTYDPFGRPHKLVRPGDTLEYPTTEYLFVLAEPTGVDGLVNYIETRLLDRKPSVAQPRGPPEPRMQYIDHYFVSRRFLDGSGRALYTKHEAEPNPKTGQLRAVITGAIKTNRRGKPYVYFNPFFSERHDQDVLARLTYEPLAKKVARIPREISHFDAMLRPRKRIHNDGSFSETRYEPLVEVLFGELDQKTNTPIRRLSDGLGRLIGVDEIVAAKPKLAVWKTRYRYDLGDKLTKLIDSQKNTKTIAYDDLGRVTKIADPNSGVRKYQYDSASNTVESSDGRGFRIVYRYDGANRVLSEDWFDASTGKDVDLNELVNDFAFNPDQPRSKKNRGDVEYFYDGNDMSRGHMTEVWDRSGWTKFLHDVRGRTVCEEKYIDVASKSFTTKTTYDSLDRTVVLTYPDGDEAINRFNERNLLASSQLQSIGTAARNIDYNAAEKRIACEYGNGVVHLWEYDDRLRLSRLESKRGDLFLQHLQYTYDTANNIKAIADLRLGVAPQLSLGQAFEYDALHRVTQVTYTSTTDTIRYEYDQIGNLLVMNGVNVLADIRYGVDNLRENRQWEAGKPGPCAVTMVNGVRNHYDACGNLIREGNSRYFWDANDRLIGYSAQEEEYRYEYDYQGNRVVKRELGNGGHISIYVGPHYRAEIEDNTTTTKSVFLGLLRIAEVSTGQDEQQIRFTHHDHLGSSNVVTDESGRQVSALAYHPFGEARFTNGNRPKYQFGGKERDDESGLHFFGARYLSTRTGRFTSCDAALLLPGQLDNPQTLNPYTYAANRPLTHNDPDGNVIGFVITGAFSAVDVYNYATGNMSKAEFSKAMALNGAALLADVATGGAGGGLAVRIANVGIRTAKIVDRANTTVETAKATYTAASSIADGDWKTVAEVGGVMLLGAGLAKRIAKPSKRAPNKGAFPKTADEMTDILGVPPKKVGTTPHGTIKTVWEPNANTRIRHESHPGDPGYNPRHHGEHFHVETKPSGITWGQAKRRKLINKAKPVRYSRGGATGFLPGEFFPGE